MLLDINNIKHIPLMEKYGKTKGSILLKKYFPDMIAFDKFFLVPDEEALAELKDIPLRKSILRSDSLIGKKPTYLFGRPEATFAGISKYFYELKSENHDGAMICMNMLEGMTERVKSDGGINIAFEIGKHIIIDYVGKCFDSRECTRGIANHESYYIPWKKGLFLDADNLSNFLVQSISQQAYEETVKNRREFLIQIGNDKDYVEDNMPSSYVPMPKTYKRKILDQIIFYLLDMQDDLLKDGLNNFGVQGNLISDKIILIEMNRPERFTY